MGQHRKGCTGAQAPDGDIDTHDPANGSPTPVISRELTRREREVLALMIDHAARFDPDNFNNSVEDAERERWRAQLVTARAGRPCGCGSCPSIELTDAAGVSPKMTSRRVVLDAETDGAMVMLFIDDDRLSYLELAPTGDRAFAAFPDPTDIRTA